MKKQKVERVKPIKFLGALLDENLSWEDHIKYIENKVAKSIGLFYRAKLLRSYFVLLHGIAHFLWASSFALALL